MGWVHNVDGPLKGHSSQKRFIGVTTGLFGLAIIAVCLRIYVRTAMVKSFGKDDVAILFAIVMSAGYWICGIMQTRWGQGLSAIDFPVENAMEFSKIQYTGSTFYTMGLLGFKLALLFAYLRITGFNKVHRMIIYVVIAATFANQIVFTCVLDFSCHPISYQWDISVKGGHCINEVPWFYALAATTLFLDVVIIALPLPVLARLQLEKRKKLALVCVFALGFFVTIIQIIRMTFIKELKTWTDSESLILWSQIELNLGILVTCIPTFAPLVHSFRSLTSRNRGSKPQYGYGSSSQRSGSRPQNRHSSLYKLKPNPYTIRTEDSNISTAVDSTGGVYAMDDMAHKEVSIRGGGVDGIQEGKRGTFGYGDGNGNRKGSGVVVHHTSVHGDAEDGGLGSQERIVRSGEEGGIRATTEVKVEYDRERGVGKAY